MSCMVPTSVFSAFPIHTTTPDLHSFTLLQLSSCHFSMKVLTIIALLAGLNSAKLQWQTNVKRGGDEQVFHKIARENRVRWDSLFKARPYEDVINYGRPRHDTGQDMPGKPRKINDVGFSTLCDNARDPCGNKSITFWKNPVQGRPHGELRGFFCTDDKYHRGGPMCNPGEISFPEFGERSEYFCCPWGFQKDNGGCQRYVLFDACPYGSSDSHRRTRTRPYSHESTCTLKPLESTSSSKPLPTSS